MRTVISVILLLALCISAIAAIQGQEVRFGPNNQYRGYLVRPTGSGPYPGLVVIHEWWGLNTHIRSQADRLAEAGYAALAVDLFDGFTTEQSEAMKQVQNLNQEAATAEMLAAANYLRTQPFVKADRVGSIGWCFGGGQSLLLAINDPKLRTAVIYYGQPVTDVSRLSKINVRILGIFGEADQSIPMTQVEEFKKALNEAKVNNEIITYEGAPHAFANPSRGENYRPEAAEDAWKRTVEFLNKYLAQ